jgi:transposase
MQAAGAAASSSARHNTGRRRHGEVFRVADPTRFARKRDVGAFLGLVPGRDQSGETDKQLRITKAGNR